MKNLRTVCTDICRLARGIADANGYEPAQLKNTRSSQMMIKIIVVVMCCLLPQDASAYLDPGTGSYIFQIIIAGLIAALFFVKLSWRRIKNAIKRIFSKIKNKKNDV